MRKFNYDEKTDNSQKFLGQRLKFLNNPLNRKIFFEEWNNLSEIEVINNGGKDIKNINDMMIRFFEDLKDGHAIITAILLDNNNFVDFDSIIATFIRSRNLYTLPLKKMDYEILSIPDSED